MVKTIGELYQLIVRSRIKIAAEQSSRGAVKTAIAVATRKFLRSTLSTVVYAGKVFMPERGHTVLAYRHISDDIEPGAMAVPVASFERQMKYLCDAKENVLITFDDGWSDTYSNAFPILKKYELKGRVFLTVGKVDTLGYLTTGQVKEMSDYGIEFGGQALFYHRLPLLPEKEAEKEITRSMEFLRKIKVEARWAEYADGGQDYVFCYPYGDYNDEIKRLVNKAGFTAAFTMNPGKNTDETDRFELRRTKISGIDTLFDFRKKLAGAYDILHRVVRR